MNRKYLDDIGVTDRPDTWNDSRQERFKKQREEYGFDERETWTLEFSFYLWLYERLKMFLEVNCIDLDFHKFTYKENEYTQQKMIDMMLERLEFYFSEEYDDYNEEHYEKVKEIGEIWTIVLPSMWW